MPEELKDKHAIVLIEQEDGNWKGWYKDHEVRDIDPNTVLVRLLTHS